MTKKATTRKHSRKTINKHLLASESRENDVAARNRSITILEMRGTSGGTATCLHITTIRIVSHASIITTFSISALTIIL